jgi:hypothetical protein
MVRDFEIMSLNFGSLIFYGLDEYPFYVVDSLAESYGMDYWAGAYCGSYTTESSRLGQVRSYLDRVDSLGHIGFLGLVYGYNTGNLEGILEEMGTISSEYPDVALTHFEYVDVVKREGWFYSDSLIDVVPVCVFPDQDIRLEDLEEDPGIAVSYIRDQYNEVCSIYSDKRVVLYEVGLSTYNLSEGVQSEIFASLVSWIERDSVEAYLFEFRDQPWKMGRDEEYGLFDKDMGAKRFTRDNLKFPHERISFPFGDSVVACFYSDIFKTKSREGSVIWSANSEDIKAAADHASCLILGGYDESDEFGMCDSFISSDIPYGMVFSRDTVSERPYYGYASNAEFILIEYNFRQGISLIEEIRAIAPGVAIGLVSKSTQNSLSSMVRFSPYLDFLVTRHYSSAMVDVVAMIDSFSLVNSIPIIPSYYGPIEDLLEQGDPFIYVGNMSNFIKDMDKVSVLPRDVFQLCPGVLEERERLEFYSVLGRRVPHYSDRRMPSSVLLRRGSVNPGEIRRVLRVR